MTRALIVGINDYATLDASLGQVPGTLDGALFAQDLSVDAREADQPRHERAACAQSFVDPDGG